jgi:hypothetical protein
MVCGTFLTIITATWLNTPLPHRTGTIQECSNTLNMAQAKLIEYKQMHDTKDMVIYDGRIYRVQPDGAQVLVQEITAGGQVRDYPPMPKP